MNLFNPSVVLFLLLISVFFFSFFASSCPGQTFRYECNPLRAGFMMESETFVAPRSFRFDVSKLKYQPRECHPRGTPMIFGEVTVCSGSTEWHIGFWRLIFCVLFKCYFQQQKRSGHRHPSATTTTRKNSNSYCLSLWLRKIRIKKTLPSGMMCDQSSCCYIACFGADQSRNTHNCHRQFEREKNVTLMGYDEEVQTPELFFFWIG